MKRLPGAISKKLRRNVFDPGGKLTVKYLRKKPKNAHCRISGKRLQGLKALRPSEMHRAKNKRKWKPVKRKYGGNLSHKVVKERSSEVPSKFSKHKIF